VVGGVFQHANPYANIYYNGVSEGTETVDDFTDNAWGTTFSVGSTNSGEWWYGIISSIAIFSDAKSATDVLRITNELNRTYYGNAFERGSFILGDMDVRDVYDGMR
jgi:hypothetical protein